MQNWGEMTIGKIHGVSYTPLYISHKLFCFLQIVSDNSPKVQMCFAWQMCSIHIRKITMEMHPSFEHRKRQKIYTRKADWSEKNLLLSLATRNQLLLEQESTKTMPKRTTMPSHGLFKERSNFFTKLRVVKYIL